jgi:predicted permease
MSFLNQLRAIFRRGKLESDLDEELRFHVEMKTREFVEAGMPPDKARAAALRQFGNLARTKEDTRTAWTLPRFETFVQDLRYGLRQLRRNPGFTAVAIATLALGIGCAATMFNALEAALFTTPHVKDVDRIVYLRATNLSAGWDRSPVSVSAFYDWRDQSDSFEALAAYTAGTANLAGISEPVRVSVQRVSADFFRVMGVAPTIGRPFREGEDGPKAGATVILSHHLWERSFGSRRDALGQTIRLDDQPMTVVGVIPAGFGFPTPGTDLWIPLTLDPARSPRSHRYLAVVGLLKPNVSAKQAQKRMDSIARRMEEEHRVTERGWGVKVTLVRDEMLKRVALGLAGFLGPSVCVLLIVCANLAGLLLARATTRQREIAVRVALGAGRGRLLRQLITENLLLSLAGGAFGVVLAHWGIHLVRIFMPSTTSHYVTQALQIDLGVLGFILAVSFLAPLVFGLAPALAVSKLDLVEELKGVGRKPALTARGHSLRDIFVALEITLAMVLLTTVGIWGKALLKLERVETGFDPTNLLTLRPSPPESSYPSEDQLRAFYRRVLEKATAVPGVEVAAVSSFLPASGREQSSLTQINLNANSAPGEAWDTTIVEQSVSPDYFSAMRIPLLEGRYFSSQDSPAAPLVALVSRSMARRFWKGQDPLGKRFELDGAGTKTPWVTVVGVVGDVMNDRRLGPPLPYVYLPYAQHPTRSAAAVVRTAGRPGSLATALRSAIQSVDENLPLNEATTMEQRLSLQELYFMIGLVAVFAFLALVLAAVGVYGVASFMANARTREIGIRMALGARPPHILRLIAQQGVSFILVGVGLGVLGAVTVALVLRSQVAGVSSADPIVLSLSALVLTGTAMVATYIPARRATKVDPLVALRYE